VWHGVRCWSAIVQRDRRGSIVAGMCSAFTWSYFGKQRKISVVHCTAAHICVWDLPTCYCKSRHLSNLYFKSEFCLFCKGIARICPVSGLLAYLHCTSIFLCYVTTRLVAFSGFWFEFGDQMDCRKHVTV
jgi:hypothetical protein